MSLECRGKKIGLDGGLSLCSPAMNARFIKVKVKGSSETLHRDGPSTIRIMNVAPVTGESRASGKTGSTIIPQQKNFYRSD